MKPNYTDEELGRLFLYLNNNYNPVVRDKWISLPGLYVQHMRNAIRSENVKWKVYKDPIKEKILMSNHDIKQTYLDPEKKYDGIDSQIANILDVFGVDIGVRVIASSVETYMGVSSDFVKLRKSGRLRKKQFTKHLNPAFAQFKSELEEIIRHEVM